MTDKRGPLDAQPDEPGWWIASDGKWYPPESAAPQQPTLPTTIASPSSAGAFAASSPTPAEPKKPGWFKRNWIAVTAVAVALFLGVGIGAAANTKQDEIDKQAAQIKTLSSEKDALQKQVDDRTSKQSADEAAAKRIEEERQAAKEKAAADKKAAADAKAAAAKKAAADKAAAAKKAADDKRKADAAAFAAAAAQQAKMNSFDSDGVREVGVDINPGRWKTEGAGDDCYYAILNSSDTSNIADNNITAGPATVDLRAGQFFDTKGCAAWTKVG